MAAPAYDAKARPARKQDSAVLMARMMPVVAEMKKAWISPSL
jgi:hypothetical protein